MAVAFVGLLKLSSSWFPKHFYAFVAGNALSIGLIGAITAGTFIFSNAAAISFANPLVLTVTRGLGSSILFMMFTGWKIPKPDFTIKEWILLLTLGILPVSMNQYQYITRVVLASNRCISLKFIANFKSSFGLKIRFPSLLDSSLVPIISI